MTALSKRAVACKGWRWMPRMRMVGGETILSVTLHDGSWWAALGDHPELDGFETYWQPTLPDLDDPATLGCLLSLVREAWGSDVTIYEMSGGRGVSLVISEAGARGVVLFKGTGGTLAERRVAALEAAPQPGPVTP